MKDPEATRHNLEQRREIYRLAIESHERFTYFFLTASGSTIALALAQTSEGPLSRWMLPVGVAILCWGVSFALGCTRIGLALHLQNRYLKIFDIAAGSKPTVATPDQPTIRELQEIAAELGRLAAWQLSWQYRLFLIGAAFYVAGHAMRLFP